MKDLDKLYKDRADWSALEAQAQRFMDFTPEGSLRYKFLSMVHRCCVWGREKTQDYIDVERSDQ